MSVASVSNSSAWVAQLRGAATGHPRHSDGDGDDDAGVHGTRQSRGGGFVNAMASALSAMGLDVSKLSPSATTTAPGTTTDGASATSNSAAQDPSQALSSFMHTLMDTLQAQGTQPAGSGPQAASDPDGDGDGSSPVGGGHGHHHHGNLKAELQGLIQKLGTGSSSGGSDAAASDPALAALQQSFQNLASAFGDSDSKATLQNFLQSLSSQLDQQPPQGQLVNATA